MKFKDVPETDPGFHDISMVAAEGIMIGDGETFRPDDTLTRREMAHLTARLLFRVGLLTSVIPKTKKAVVRLQMAVPEGIASGSGVFISSDGYLITNAHVVGDSKTLDIIDEDDFPGGTVSVIAVSPNHDLALCKYSGTTPAWLELSDIDVYTGQHVAVVGQPKGYIDSITQGVVSHTKRAATPVGDPDGFQVDAAISPGNSGGPVIDAYGRIVGIVNSKFVGVDTEGIGFAIHGRYVREFLQQHGIIAKPVVIPAPDPNKLSEHFTKQEFTCKCGCGEMKADPKLIDLLEKLRAEAGRPVYISSGYRCPKHNKAIGGAENSYHMKGMAADITIPQHNPYEIGQIARKLGFGGIGTYTNGGNFFCHVDVGPVRNWTD